MVVSIPTNSPLHPAQVEHVRALLPTLDAAQSMWLSGFLAACAQGSSVVAGGCEVHVLYASQTGNAERLAKKLGALLTEHGHRSTVWAMREVKVAQLKKMGFVCVIASTHGEGEPPDNGRALHELLHSARAPKLDGMRYAVLSLGDCSYPLFCQTGIDFDQRFAALGAQRLRDRVDCDVDYDDAAAQWMNDLVRIFGSAAAPHVQVVAQEERVPAVVYSRAHPWQATVLENTNLNGRGSDRETRHIALSLDGSSLVYEPGDCIGIFPHNDPALVQDILDVLDWDGDAVVALPKSDVRVSLREAFGKHLEITVVSKSLLNNVQAYSAHEQLHAMMQAGQEAVVKAYVSGIDVLDVLRDFAPWTFSPEVFVGLLRKLPPRLYSIASSQRANADEVHVTIRAVRYASRGRVRHGVCSVYCAERVQPGDTVSMYVHTNANFKLPPSHDTPIIMVGPGTGVAPFRAFMEDREAVGARGDAWLFFGDRHFVTDFLYQTEWQRWLHKGVLTKLDVAFSRDGDRKVYVQHRMRAQASALYAWLERGAVLYVCGDASAMARDVHAALLAVVQEQGGMSEAEAVAYVEQLIAQQRYQRDVY